MGAKADELGRVLFFLVILASTSLNANMIFYSNYFSQNTL